MTKTALRLIYSFFVWKIVCIRYHILKSTMVLFLSGENRKLDEYSIKYLPDVLKRKSLEKTLIFVESWYFTEIRDTIASYGRGKEVRVIKTKYVDAIYYLYRMVRFSPSVFFTYTDKTKDNLLGRFLRETEINEKDAVCLAIYNFRSVLEE